MWKSSALLLTSFALLAQTALAVTVVVESTNATPGDTPYICVNLPDNDGQVSGIQMDLSWDPSCLNIVTQSATEGACAVNPATNRTTFRTRVNAGNSMKVLMFNMSDTTPIPASEQQLFCCQFQVSPAAAGRTCGINLSNVIASSATGTRLPVSPRPGTITVGGARGDSQMHGGGGLPGALVIPPIVTGGEAPAPAAGSAGTGAAGSGAAAPAAGRAVVPAAPAAPAVPAAPEVPEIPAAEPVPDGAAPAATVGAEHVAGTPATDTTPRRTPAAGSPTVKSTVKETAKPIGTPTPEAHKTDHKDTPTPKKKKK